MKCLVHLRRFTLIIVLAAAVLAGCGTNSSDYTGDAPEINEEFSEVTFKISGILPDVNFAHKTHAEYLDNNCFECHSHTSVRDNTIWNCNACHSTDNSEELCVNDAEGHACWMVQCQKCHETLDPNPTPNCSDCHN